MTISWPFTPVARGKMEIFQKKLKISVGVEIWLLYIWLYQIWLLDVCWEVNTDDTDFLHFAPFSWAGPLAGEKSFQKKNK